MDTLLACCHNFDLIQRKVKLNGTIVNYDIVCHYGAVAILPIIDNQCVLVKQYRPPIDKEILELPAGTIENGDSPEETAFRELEEETGYRAAKIEKMCSFYSCPGYSTEFLHLFLATELSSTKQKLDETEDIAVVLLNISDAMEMIRSGEIVDGKTILAIELFVNRH